MPIQAALHQAEQISAASEKAMKQNADVHMKWTWDEALSMCGRLELAQTCPPQLRLKSEMNWVDNDIK